MNNQVKLILNYDGSLTEEQVFVKISDALQDGNSFIIAYPETPSSPSNDYWKEEAKKLLEGYEQWEADIISCDEMWWPKSHKDVLPNHIYEKMLELQGKRNELLERFQLKSNPPKEGD